MTKDLSAVWYPEDYEVVVAGASAALNQFADLVEQAGECSLAAAAVGKRGVPLHRIAVVRKPGPIEISATGDCLQITGELWESLAASVRFVAAKQLGGLVSEHLDIAYYPEHPFLSPESFSLIVRLERTSSVSGVGRGGRDGWAGKARPDD